MAGDPTISLIENCVASCRKTDLLSWARIGSRHAAQVRLVRRDRFDSVSEEVGEHLVAAVDVATLHATGHQRPVGIPDDPVGSFPQGRVRAPLAAVAADGLVLA